MKKDQSQIWKETCVHVVEEGLVRKYSSTSGTAFRTCKWEVAEVNVKMDTENDWDTHLSRSAYVSWHNRGKPAPGVDRQKTTIN
jgi:hypothetical protein